jgi:hypothetical protein
MLTLRPIKIGPPVYVHLAYQSIGCIREESDLPPPERRRFWSLRKIPDARLAGVPPIPRRSDIGQARPESESRFRAL